MTVYLHDVEMSIGEGMHLTEFLVNQNFDQKKGIAVAINSQVIPKDTWSSHLLKEGAKIIIIQATQGG